MVVEARAGQVDDPTDDTTNNSFPLFGHNQVSAQMAAMDGVNLFAARMDAFDTMMQSVTKHYHLKNDLTTYISKNF